MYTCSQLSSHNIQLLYHHIDTYNRHHHHSGSCNEHTSIILCARAAIKQTTTSGAATTYYYHHHHTVQVTILRPPHAFLDENERHHHHTVQVTMHAFSICTIALEKTPPPPHSASYNITATTTCVSTVSALVGHEKRPPVQVTVAPAPFAPPHVPESKCTQRLKKKTTSASYSRSELALPPLECTLQQANVTCLRACH